MTVVFRSREGNMKPHVMAMLEMTNASIYRLGCLGGCSSSEFQDQHSMPYKSERHYLGGVVGQNLPLRPAQRPLRSNQRQ
ncbi:hypothetical protein HDF08_002223 [Edaphobacter lichenicola]|uniref:Uncharacterized protein n=1 Tax=Tunturiibacter lichenicola TaxID=2051959 RepID=A0A852VKU0_9BACT|nr:hypothetical protein [Edaphobacter lichenicola]